MAMTVNIEVCHQDGDAVHVETNLQPLEVRLQRCTWLAPWRCKHHQQSGGLVRPQHRGVHFQHQGVIRRLEL